MTRVLIGKGLPLDGSTLKAKDKQVPSIYIYISLFTYKYICIYKQHKNMYINLFALKQHYLDYIYIYTYM